MSKMKHFGWTRVMSVFSPVFVVILGNCFLSCEGNVYINVSPYPARVYENAPPGVPVVMVNAYDNQTGEALHDFRLEKWGLSDYFSINSSGLMQTAKTIDRIIGFKFRFFVFVVSTATGSAYWKHVIVEVSEKNLYAPQFSRSVYNFSVYRYAPEGTLMGRVPATDRDTDPYNRHFAIYAPPRQTDLDYVTVTSTGDVLLRKTPPDGLSPLRLKVLAVDDGSPQLTGTATVVVIVEDVNQPSTFCLSTTRTETILCWKNPMPGRHHGGYNVVVQGEGLVLHKHVPGEGDVDEFCVSTADLVIGRNYTFKVTLDTDDTISAAGVELAFQKPNEGFSPDCKKKNFAICNYLNPCQNGAKCVMGDNQGLNYTCECPSGFQGKNCSQEDLCTNQPCRNGGTCHFKGNRQYECSCPPMFYGQTCRKYNVCTDQPCQNNGVCQMHDDGTYSCTCPDYFSGTVCSIPDPCSPSPCGDHGQCVKISDTEFDCICSNASYYGARCDQIDRCQTPQVCKNGGSCLTTGNNTFSCLCSPEFTGAHCDVYNACLHVCKNNASCELSDDGRYNCTCLPGFHGNECQHFNRCHANPCNNGTCNVEEDMPLCTCNPGFYGPECDQYNPCLTDPCGGHGDCTQIPSSEQEEGELPFECQCYDGWWGLRCAFADICQLDVCQNGAKCQNTPPNNFSCLCLPGYYENDCSKYNPCYVEESGDQQLCLNGGICHNTTTSSFQCECVDGHYGETCQNRNLCYSSPCLNGGHCTNVSDTQYNCTCNREYSGRHCEYETCYKRPCSTGGTCFTDSASKIPRCHCKEGFLGTYCQIQDPCVENKDSGLDRWCKNGSCEMVNRTMAHDLEEDVKDLDFLFRCQCDQWFTGKRCDVPIDRCASVQCLNDGDCQGGVCICPPTHTGLRCETPVSPCKLDPCADGLVCQTTGPLTYACVCQNGWDPPECKPVCRAEQSVSEEKGTFQWPQASAGHTVMAICPYGGRTNDTFASRTCLQDGPNGASWGEPEDEGCNEKGLSEASRRLSALKDLTSNPAGVGASQMNNYTAILEDLYVYTLQDRHVATLMMNVISNLGDVNVSVTVSSNKENNTSERLLNVLHQYTADVNLTEGENVSITSPNFELVALSVQNASSSVSFVPTIVTGNSSEKMDVKITIPPEAFAEDSNETTPSQKLTRLQMIGHRKSQLFIPDSKYNESFIENQPVLTVIVTGRQIVNLTTPVVYRIRNLQPDANYTCVFWDPTSRAWSEEGVETVVKSGNSTVCHSSHLTSFAVLLDPSPHYHMSVVNEKVLTYISYIGSGLSLFCLVLTIITYGLFRSLNKDKSGKILLNLCVALLLLNAVFLANGLATSDNNGLDEDATACTAVAVLLHYLLLASLAWMLVEAVEMYRALVTVFAKYAQCYMLKRCLIGWGVPIIIVAITIGVDKSNYETEGTFCFISRNNPAAYYGSLVAPACAVLLVNTVIFVMVTRVILKPRFQQQKQKEAEGITPAQVRGAFTVMFLLGVTWVFGPLAIREAKVVFNYLFCILNSLQGFLIFVFRCLFNPEVRMCWVQLVKTGTLKKRRGPIRSNVYSDTSSKADAKSGSYPNGSHGSRFADSNGSSTTTKTSIRAGNGWHPKLNGFPGGQVLERRGTKFSTLDFYQSTPESAKKVPQNSTLEDERYGNGNLDDIDVDPKIFSAEDYYESGHESQEKKPAALSYEDSHGEGDVLDYYESIRTNRKDDGAHMNEADHSSGDNTESRERRASSGSEKRLSGTKSESDGLTAL